MAETEVDGRALYQQAHEHLMAGKLNEADELFNVLLNNNKESEVLLHYLSTVYTKKGNHALAIILLQEALRRRPDFIDAINNLGYVYKQEQMTEEGRQVFHQLIEMIEKPSYEEERLQTYTQSDLKDALTPHARLVKEKSEFIANLGSMYIATGTPEKAVDILNKAVALDNNNGLALWNRSLAYLELGDYEKGFADYEYGERTERTKQRDYHIKDLPFWDGTPGKTVVVYGEQGLGDELMFASMLPDIMKDCLVILDAHPRLADLFRLNFPAMPVYGTRKEKNENLLWTQFHKIDAKIAIGSLGKFYRKKKEDFPRTPYLKADPHLVAKHKAQLAALSTKPKIGISWKGGTLKTNKNSRKIPMGLLLPLLECDATFISLQYDKDAYKQVEKFNERFPVHLHHSQSLVDDYDETAGLIANLDLIISVPQSVVHLAGAQGVPTWQLCPKEALWQMGPYGEDMPWYGSVKNFWQDDSKTWEPVIQQVKGELCSLLQTRTAA
jgi:tetratricopeptide (TPR) repeat protein